MSEIIIIIAVNQANLDIIQAKQSALEAAAPGWAEPSRVEPRTKM